jgi:hypothetical protein
MLEAIAVISFNGPADNVLLQSAIFTFINELLQRRFGGLTELSVCLLYCKKLIDVVGKGGGYILGPRSSTDEVKPENLKAMIEFTKEYGRYSDRLLAG